jgi:heat shock protein HslJ
MTAARVASSLIIAATALGSGCGAPSSRPPEPTPAAEQVVALPSGPPTLEELRNATYHGLETPTGPFDLADGLWAGEPFDESGASRPTVTFADDFRVLGDLDGDGVDEAAVVLAASSGGSGTFDYLAVVGRAGDGRVDNLDTVALGDRVQIRDARIEGGQLLVDLVTAGPEDAACCPGELVRRGWTLADGRLDQVVSETTGRLSLETLAGSEWVLRRWGWDEPAPAEPEVTLSYADGRVAGSDGCNSYSASVTAGLSPGDISVGVVAGTRMACPEPAASVEQRFLSQLGRVMKYGFALGRLALTYRLDDEIGVMLFEPGPAGDQPS